MTDPGWLAREIAELERRMARWPDWKRREFDAETRERARRGKERDDD